MVSPLPNMDNVMQNEQIAPNQPENLLGICHAIGQTFGFNPIYLRVALLAVVMVNAEVALGAYAICGVAVMAARMVTWREPWVARTTTRIPA